MVEWAGCALVRGACGIVQASYDDFVLLERLFENLALSVEPFAESWSPAGGGSGWTRSNTRRFTSCCGGAVS